MSTRGLYVLVKVLSVNRNYAFPCCIRCSTRIRTEDDENIFLCSKCQQKYDKKDISYRYRVNMTVSDRTQVSNVTVFGNCLETFFGTSATHLKRFVEGLYLEKEELPLPVDQLVYQCIEQCFVGSMIRLCFHGLHPRLTDSQASRSSPTHLKNILRKMQESKMNYLPRQQQNTSHLLASYMSRPESTEKNTTVLELLKEYLEFFRCSSSLTPSGRYTCSTNGPNSISYFGLQHNTSFQSNARLHSKDFGRKSYEDFNSMVSPLMLSCEIRGSSQSPATVDLPIQIHSEVKSQTRIQNTPILDNSPNRTALMLVSLLNIDTSEEFIDDSSSDLTNDADKSRSSCDSSEYLKCSNDPAYLTEDIFHDKRDNQIETEELACFDSQSIIGKSINIRNAIENEKQELHFTCAWPENDHSLMIDQKDFDFFLDEDLNSFFANLSLDSNFERNKGTDDKSQCAEKETYSIDDQHCHRLDNSREFQDHKCNSLQEKTDQVSSLLPGDVLTDLEFSNFSFLYEYDKLQEPRPSIAKASPATPQEHKSWNKEHSKDSLKDFIQNPSEINGSSHASLQSNEVDCCRRTSLCYTSTDKPCQNKFSTAYSSESPGTPAQLSFQFCIEQTSTPVLFDDSWDSTHSRLELYRSSSFPEALQSADVMKRDTFLNIHSTPLNIESERKFKDLSGDLQNYSGLFVNDRKKHNFVGPTVSLNAKAPNKDGFNCYKNFPTPIKSLQNTEYIHDFSSACNHRRMEEGLEREDNRDPNFVEHFSVQSEMTPGEVTQERWQTRDQTCQESPLLFSFSSTENTSYKMTPDFQQDSLLCASLLECSYLN